jgi:hypothetical protein
MMIASDISSLLKSFSLLIMDVFETAIARVKLVLCANAMYCLMALLLLLCIVSRLLSFGGGCFGGGCSGLQSVYIFLKNGT